MVVLFSLWVLSKNYKARIAETNESRAKFGMPLVEEKLHAIPDENTTYRNGGDVVAHALHLANSLNPVPPGRLRP